MSDWFTCLPEQLYESMPTVVIGQLLSNRLVLPPKKSLISEKMMFRALALLEIFSLFAVVIWTLWIRLIEPNIRLARR